MVEKYNQLKETLANKGYDSALKLVEELPVRNEEEVLLKTNFYCCLAIHSQGDNSRCLTILQQCAAHPHCKGGLRALTRYHISQLFFSFDVEACGRQCEEVVGQFIGDYHMLRSNSQPSPEQEQELWLFQYVLYYCMLMLGYLRRSEGKTIESQNYLRASQNLLKIGNRSSQLINASNLRTRSAQQKKRSRVSP